MISLFESDRNSGGPNQMAYPIRSIVAFNPLPDMSILGFSNSAANKDMMSKI